MNEFKPPDGMGIIVFDDLSEFLKMVGSPTSVIMSKDRLQTIVYNDHYVFVYQGSEVSEGVRALERKNNSG